MRPWESRCYCKLVTLWVMIRSVCDYVKLKALSGTRCHGVELRSLQPGFCRKGLWTVTEGWLHIQAKMFTTCQILHVSIELSNHLRSDYSVCLRSIVEKRKTERNTHTTLANIFTLSYLIISMDRSSRPPSFERVFEVVGYTSRQ